jgi:uncharacterized membrane protein YccC
MDTGYSTIRNLLYFVLALVVLAILSNVYVASQLARNSDELASLRQLLAKQLMGSALTEAEELQKRMDALNESANSIDAKLQKAQDDFAARMQVELPRIMDNYVKERMPLVEKQLEKRAQPLTKR